MLTNRRITIWVLGTIFVASASVIFFTIPLTKNLFSPSVTGPIGDTIGGLTAPIINLFTSILLLLTLREQQRSNRIILSDREFDRINSLINEFKESIEEIEFSYNIDGNNILKKGNSAIEEFINQYDNNEIINSNQYLDFIKQHTIAVAYIYLILKRLESNTLDINDRILIYRKFLMYHIHIEASTNSLNSCMEKNNDDDIIKSNYYKHYKELVDSIKELNDKLMKELDP